MTTVFFHNLIGVIHLVIFEFQINLGRKWEEFVEITSYCIDLTPIMDRSLLEIIVMHLVRTLEYTRCALRALFIKMFMTDFMIVCVSFAKLQAEPCNAITETACS